MGFQQAIIGLFYRCRYGAPWKVKHFIVVRHDTLSPIAHPSDPEPTFKLEARHKV
jgi:hypothetical protein